VVAAAAAPVMSDKTMIMVWRSDGGGNEEDGEELGLFCFN